jgi:ribose transport system ATP-binding protein
MISIDNLYKSYGSTNVLADVSLRLDGGQIHALLGPNGSGKSTLTRCLSGAIRPDAGTITHNGVAASGFTPRSARDAGIAVIYQNFSLVPTLSIAENVFLGSELRSGVFVDRSRQKRVVLEQLERLGRRLDPDVRVQELRAGDRQIVEIVKALHFNPSALILDEPTAALGESEIAALAETLTALRDQGMTIMYVTHEIREVFAIGDYVTVLRDGHVVLSELVGDVTPDTVISAIAPTRQAVERTDAGSSDGPVAIALSSYSTKGLAPLDLQVARGEVLGIFGLLGSGRTELLEGIYGIRRGEGTITVGGKPYRASSPAEALRFGLALVAGERLRQSMFLRLSALENLLMPHFQRFARRHFRSWKREKAEFERVGQRLRLFPNRADLAAETFSGGNQQKLAVGRWLAAGAEVQILLLDEPTQGIDVGARSDLYTLVRDLGYHERKTVLFTSSDPDETLMLADRIIVLRGGTVVKTVDQRDATSEMLLAYAHGSQS